MSSKKGDKSPAPDSSDNNSSEQVRAVVTAYYAAVADLTTTPEVLAPLLAKKLTITEHPNAITPTGASRDRQETLDGFSAGKTLLREQSFDVHEILVSGDRAAVRATWRGTIGVEAGPLHPGTELLAHVASFLTVRDGAVVDQETFDCYEPF